MVQFTTTILQFAHLGEKTGWTYIVIPADIAEVLKPGVRKSFRVKGKLDDFAIKRVALFPTGDGSFIMPVNAAIRKGTRKKKGAMLKVQLAADNTPLKLNQELLECLSDEPVAEANFKKMPPSHQSYFSKWIESAKTEPTKTKRIAQTVTAMSRGIDFGEMIRSNRKE